jgi:3-hydroxybutyryl-CoA dehydrogenase
MMESFKKIGVIGAGMMGSEIALAFAMGGFQVSLKDETLALASKGKENMTKSLDKFIKKGKLAQEDKSKILGRVTPVENYEAMGDAGFVIEAVFENIEVKKTVFSTLDKICRDDCIFATNTSSISITLLSTSVKKERLGRFLGAHFFSPASVMKLVEVIPGLDTKEETVKAVLDLMHSIGKEPIRVKDVVGFAVNRIFHAMLIEACRLLEEEVATPEDIDKACKLGLGHPMGPYELMDVLNNRLNLNVQEILFDSYGERFRPRPNLKQRVNANHLGRVTGRGWYDYSSSK